VKAWQESEDSISIETLDSRGFTGGCCCVHHPPPPPHHPLFFVCFYWEVFFFFFFFLLSFFFFFFLFLLFFFFLRVPYMNRPISGPHLRSVFVLIAPLTRSFSLPDHHFVIRKHAPTRLQIDPVSFLPCPSEAPLLLGMRIELFYYFSPNHFDRFAYFQVFSFFSQDEVGVMSKPPLLLFFVCNLSPLLIPQPTALSFYDIS